MGKLVGVMYGSRGYSGGRPAIQADLCFCTADFIGPVLVSNSPLFSMPVDCYRGIFSRG